MKLLLLLLCLGISVLAEPGKFWMEDIGHYGRSPYHPDSNYQVFRNVKDFGAVGNGLADDTKAINAAISSGDRCQPGVCNGSTISPATVYFPSGTYLISESIIDIFYTQLIGNPNGRATIKASSEFSNQSFALVDSNPYMEGGSLAWRSTNVFFRQIRNLEFDTTALPAGSHVIGIHWPSSQATSISNCFFLLSTEPGNNHTGIFIEEGSGGLLNDLYFNGGGKAAVFGNQQFTARNLWFYNADVAINMPWDWGWTYKSIYINKCRVGIQMDNVTKSIGSMTILDSRFEDVDIGIETTRTGPGIPGANGTLVMENVRFVNVNHTLVGPDGIILDDSNAFYDPTDLFTMGHVVDQNTFLDMTGYVKTQERSKTLLMNDKYYEQSKPGYTGVPAEGFVSARVYGVVGDGTTDDTVRLNELLSYASLNGYIVFLDSGIYLVTDTVYVPPNSRIVGEALGSVILAAGPAFGDMENPRPVVQVANQGDVGYLQWSDTIISTRGACAGAILIQYNLLTEGTPSGMWDVHARVGGFAGSDLQLSQCAKTIGSDSVNPSCIAAYMTIHITASAGGLYTENCWYWVADHDLEDPLYSQIAIYAGRGMLIESQGGPIWLSATSSEHHVLYQYQLANTKDIYLGHTQTESPYYQPHPPASSPFPVVPALNDPDFAADCAYRSDSEGCEWAWGMRILDSTNVVAYGAGLYSFFKDWNNTCAYDKVGSKCQARILSVSGDLDGVKLAGYSTVGSKFMVEKDGRDLVPAYLNNNTFGDTLALYLP